MRAGVLLLGAGRREDDDDEFGNEFGNEFGTTHRIFSGLVPVCAATNFFKSPMVSSSLHFTRIFFPSRSFKTTSIMTICEDGESRLFFSSFYTRIRAWLRKIKINLSLPFSKTRGAPPRYPAHAHAHRRFID